MNIIQILLPVFLVIGLGTVSVAAKVFKQEDSAIFSHYDYYIGFPILIFYSLAHTDFGKIGDLSFLAANVANLAIVALLVILICFLLRFPRHLIGIMTLGAIYGNVAYIGIPLNQQLFQADGASYASIIVGVVSGFCLSVGLFFVEYFSKKHTNIKSILIHLIKNPIIISVALGILASALKITLPEALDAFLSMVSKSASPIALFAIGIFLVGKHTMSPDKLKIGLLCLMNLIALPLVTYFMGHAMGISDVPFNVTVLEAATPLAATNFVIAQRYKAGEEIISGAIVVSTLLSLITMGLVMYFLNI